MESITATTTEVLYFTALKITKIETGQQFVVLGIPRWYMNHAFSSRRKAIVFFKTHNTSVVVPKEWDAYLTYRARCTTTQYKRNTLSTTCNFLTQDYETTRRHLTTDHVVQQTIHDSKIRVTPVPRAQDDSKRHRLRTHLFAGRLAELCKISRVPVFNKTTHLTERMYFFNERKFTIIYSRDDPWTSKYLTLLRGIELRAQAFMNISLLTNDQLSTIMSVVEAASSSLSSSLRTSMMERLVQHLATATGLLANVSILLAEPSGFVATAAIIAILATIAPSVVSSIQNFLFTSVRLQSGFSWVPSAISMILIVVLGAANLTAASGISICQKALKLGTTLGGIGVFHRIFTEAWKEMYPFIHEKLYGAAPGFTECLSQMGEFRNLIDQVDRFNREERHKDIGTSRTVCEEVMDMDHTLRRLYDLADRMKLRQSFTPLVRAYQKDIADWKVKVLASPCRVSGTRIEPVVLHIFGPSGVGKSRITPCLILEVLKGELDFTIKKDLSNHIYTRNAASEFWSGYNGQMAVVFDDFMQKRDSENSPNPEVFEVIQSANNAPFLVPMADLSEKANSYFVSKFMILSSNIPDLSPKSITCPAALQRRMDVVVKVTRPRTPKNTPTGFDTSCYDFTLVIDGQESTVITFEQLVTILREKREQKNRAGDAMLQDFETRRQSEPIKADLSSIPDIDRIIGQPSDMRSCQVPRAARVVRQGWFDWVFTDTKSRDMDISLVTNYLLTEKFTYSEIRAYNLERFFPMEEETFKLLSMIPETPDRSEYWAEEFCPDDSINLIEFVNVLSGTPLAERVLQRTKRGAFHTAAVRLFEEKAYNRLKQMYPDNWFIAMITQEKVAQAIAYTGLIGLFAGLCYATFKVLRPTPKILTPEQYQSMYCSTTTKVVTPEVYQELHKQNPNLCVSLTREIMDAFEEESKVAPESWDHMGKTPNLRNPVKGTRATRHGDADPASSAIVTALLNQTVQFYSTPDAIRQCGSGTFLVGRCCFLNTHVLDSLLLNEECHILFPGFTKRVSMPWSDLKIHKHPEIDLSMIEFPSSVRDHRNMVKHVCTEKDLSFKNCNVRIPVKRGISYEVMIAPASTSTEMLIVGTDPTVEESEDDCFEVKSYIEYRNTFTVEGDCGALVVLADPRVNHKICGMHVAGTRSTGFAFILVREHIDYLLDAAHATSKLEFVPPECDPVERPVIQGHVETLGCVPPVFEPTATSVRRSEIHGLFPITKAPAILRPVNGVDPMLKGAKNFGREPGYISEKDLESCRESMKAAFFVGTPKITRMLTIEEAIFGIPGVIEPMKTDTSPGYPWCLEKVPEPGKRHWIQPGFIHPDLRRAVDDLIRDARSNKISPSIFKDTLKDERRKLSRCDPSKPEDIKTRVFAASPMHLVIFLKMCYGSFFAHIQEERINNTTAIGINPYSVEWHKIVMKLREVNNVANDGDYENFDTTQPPAFIDSFFTIARQWYQMYGSTAAEDHLRMCAGRQITFAIHLCKGELYRVIGKNPSGTFGTTQINSGSNLCAFQYAWDKIFPERAGPTEFHKNVRMITNGDDVVFSVNPTYKDFTIANISAQLSNINMKITPALKEGSFVEARPIEECTFLKRGFKRIEGFYRGPLDIDVCKDMTQWTKKSRDNVAATIENCKIAARELGITEPSGETRQQLSQALGQLGCYTHLMTPREVLDDHKQFF